MIGRRLLGAQDNAASNRLCTDNVRGRERTADNRVAGRQKSSSNSILSNESVPVHDDAIRGRYPIPTTDIRLERNSGKRRHSTTNKTRVQETPRVAASGLDDERVHARVHLSDTSLGIARESRIAADNAFANSATIQGTRECRDAPVRLALVSRVESRKGRPSN